MTTNFTVTLSTTTISPNWELGKFEWEDVTFYVQFLINTVGVVGNILVIIACYIGDMFTVSVNDFVFALAIADLLAAILLLPIPEFIQIPLSPFGKTYCVLLHGHTSTLLWVSITASIFLIMTISIEGVTSARNQRFYKKIFCYKRYRRLTTLLVWLIAFVTNTRHYLGKEVGNDGTCDSTLDSWSEHACGIVVSLDISLTYILPLIIMITSYALTVSRLSQNMEKNRRNSALMNARNRATGVVIIDTIVILVCLAPSEVLFLLKCLNATKNGKYLYILERFGTTLLGVYVCANPVIYAITNPQFRLTLKTIREKVTCCCRFALFGK